MAITTGFEVLVDSSVSADKKADITQNILDVLAWRTLSVAYATTYAAGSTSTNQVSIEISGASEDFGIRVIFDSAVVGTDTVADILGSLLRVLKVESSVLVFASSYTAGDRTYNLTITLT